MNGNKLTYFSDNYIIFLFIWVKKGTAIGKVVSKLDSVTVVAKYINSQDKIRNNGWIELWWCYGFLFIYINNHFLSISILFCC